MIFQSFDPKVGGSNTGDHLAVCLRDRDADGNGLFDETEEGRTRTITLGGSVPIGFEKKYADISRDGRYVSFVTSEPLSRIDQNGFEDVYWMDTLSGSIALVSQNASGDGAGNRGATEPDISDDGMTVTFTSIATNLVPVSFGLSTQIFARNLPNAITVLVSTDSNGVPGNRWSERPAVSADGRYVVFSSASTNLVPKVDRPYYGSYRKDIVAGRTDRMDINAIGEEANDPSDSPAITADGLSVSFSSGASNLVSGDTNNKRDVFVRDQRP